MAEDAGGVGAEATQIQGAEQSCYDWQKNFNNIAGDVHNETNYLLATWTGGPSTNFRNAMMRWDEEVKKITTALAGMGGLLDTTNSVYAKGQQDAAESVDTTMNAGLAGFR